ncbi:hypothetical protein CEXT_406981 [Caerostris extrusa]|uniref:Uncharacterized protein n=1 Tax=Caerostris extrusa TaxID=172846 RepID=A0AAV4XW84_CAEEX|nr:hypothetical protein CEXT_406981 [Caerostris extrusa]
MTHLERGALFCRAFPFTEYKRQNFPIVLRTKEADICNKKRRSEVVSHEVSSIHLETSAAAGEEDKHTASGEHFTFPCRPRPHEDTDFFNTGMSFGNQINVLSFSMQGTESILNFSEKYDPPPVLPME